jgi:hypothetical protein
MARYRSLLMILLVPLLAQAAEKLSVPEAAAQAKAEAQVRDIFKVEFARTTPQERLAFAKKLLKEADETRDNAAARFVLLRHARDLAAQAGDVTLAKHAVDIQGQAFTIDLAEGETSILTTAARTVSTRDQIIAFMDLSIDAINQRMVEGDYPDAVRLLPNLSLASTHLNKPEITKLVALRSTEIREASAEYSALKLAMKRPAPNDPGAYLATGKYLCFFKNDWTQGIASLALCKDPRLQPLAEKDQRNPTASSAQMELAEAWFEAAPKPPGVLRRMMFRRAAYWYGQAMPKLGGLDKALAEKRVIVCFGAPEDARASGGHVYAVSSTKMGWREAKVTCRLLGGHLAYVDDQKEMAFLLDLAAKEICWIGLTDEDDEGHWHWLNGQPLDFSYWAPGEPNHGGGRLPEHYVHIWHDAQGRWNDAVMDHQMKFLCEWE